MREGIYAAEPGSIDTTSLVFLREFSGKCFEEQGKKDVCRR
jgi:hypothetical protein